MSISSWVDKWVSLWEKRKKILTMNERNLHYIYPNNPRSGFPIADNKLLTKEVLADCNVPIPHTHFVYDSFFSLRNLQQDLSSLKDFVIKPAHGAGGGGILIIVDRKGDHWITAGGRSYTLDALKKHISDIIFGIYSFGLNDQAMIETRIIQHAAMNEIYKDGLADLRIILHHHQPVMAMLRIPTNESDGKANLHQGAIGAGVDMDSGKIIHAIHNDQPITHHIDTHFPMIGFPVPHWERALQAAANIAPVVPLKYLGIDIAIAEDEPKLLEINVRPGIAIQNANDRGLGEALRQSIESRHD